jgi:hypothetical protein
MVSACLNLEFHLIIKYKLSGWWFQTFFIFHFIYGMSSFPLTFICFRGVGIPPTSYVWWMMGHNLFFIFRSYSGDLCRRFAGVHCDGSEVELQISNSWQKLDYSLIDPYI